MPVVPPDDSGAYRGVRYREDYVGRTMLDPGVQGVPWLRAFGTDYVIAVEPGRPVFAFQQMSDGRRRMVWFVREVEPASPRRWNGRRPPVEPLRAVLDVLVLPGEPEEGLGVGCGPDRVIMYYDNAWRLNATTGRIERVDPDDADCAD